MVKCGRVFRGLWSGSPRLGGFLAMPHAPILLVADLEHANTTKAVEPCHEVGLVAGAVVDPGSVAE